MRWPVHPLGWLNGGGPFRADVAFQAACHYSLGLSALFRDDLQAARREFSLAREAAPDAPQPARLEAATTAAEAWAELAELPNAIPHALLRFIVADMHRFMEAGDMAAARARLLALANALGCGAHLVDDAIAAAHGTAHPACALLGHLAAGSPGNLRCAYLLLQTAFATNDHVSIARASDIAHQACPDDVHCFHQWAETQMQRGKGDIVLPHIQAALAARPDAAPGEVGRLRHLIATFMVEQGCVEEGERMALSLRHWSQPLLLARAALRHGERERAARHLAEFSSSRTECPWSLSMRLALSCLQGEADEVRRWLTVAESNRQSHPGLLVARAEACAWLGATAEAESLRAAARAIDSDWAQAEAERWNSIMREASLGR